VEKTGSEKPEISIKNRKWGFKTGNGKFKTK